MQELINSGKFSARQISIIVICLLLNVSDGFDVLSWAYTADRVGNFLGLTATQLGIVGSATLLGMTIGALFLAPFSDLYGRRPLILTSVMAISLAMFATAYVNDFTLLLILRFIAGAGVGAILAGLAAIACEYTPDKYKSFAVVAITLGYPFGASFAGYIAAVLLPNYDWPSMYLFGGSVNVVLLLGVWFLLPESLHYLAVKQPKNALQRANKILRSMHKQTITELPEISEGPKASYIENLLALLAPVHRTKTLLLWSTFFFGFMCLYFLLIWIPKMIVDAGFTEQQGLIAGAAFNLGSVVGVLLIGFLAIKYSLTKMISLFMLLSSVGMVIYAIAPQDIQVLIALIFVIGIFQQGGFTGLYAAAAKLYPADICATGIGWAIGLGRFGAVAAPSMAGILFQAGTSMQVAFYIFAVPAALAGIFAYLTNVD
jgi:AAHS family 4-hydroxybenzoate transporter-like MFS transporter